MDIQFENKTVKLPKRWCQFIKDDLDFSRATIYNAIKDSEHEHHHAVMKSAVQCVIKAREKKERKDAELAQDLKKITDSPNQQTA